MPEQNNNGKSSTAEAQQAQETQEQASEESEDPEIEIGETKVEDFDRLPEIKKLAIEDAKEEARQEKVKESVEKSPVGVGRVPGNAQQVRQQSRVAGGLEIDESRLQPSETAQEGEQQANERQEQFQAAQQQQQQRNNRAGERTEEALGTIRQSEKFREIRRRTDTELGNVNRRNLDEQALVTGVQVMDRGQRFGDKVQRKLTRNGSIETPPNPATPQGFIETVGETAEELGIKQGEDIDENVEKFDQESIGGAATFGTQLGGLAIATPGAASLALREDTPSIREGVVEGGALTAQQISSDPTEFVGEEAGEEIGEAAVGAAIGGPVGAAIGAAPTPSIEVTPESVRTGKEFVKGDLGPRVTRDVEVRKPIEEAGAQAQQLSENRFVEGQEREEVVPVDSGQGVRRRRIKVGEDEVSISVREERPISRREFLGERISRGTEKAREFLGSSKGQVVLNNKPVESVQTGNVEPSLETQTNVRARTRLTPDSIPVSQTPVDQNTSNFPDNRLEREIDSEQELEAEEEPKLEFTQVPELEEEFTSENVRLENRFDQNVESRAERGFIRSPEISDEEQQFERLIGSSSKKGSQSFEFAPSVESITFGIEGSGESQTFTGFEPRGF